MAEEKIEESREEVFGIETTGRSPTEIELEWFEKYYRGGLPQLMWRAVLFGMALGGVMSLSNLYVGLKTGWGLGVAITACVLSFSMGALLQRIGLLRTNLSILENNCMQSTASSAGYSTGSTIVGAIIAWILSTEAEEFAKRYTVPVASGVIAGESLMGVLVALLGASGSALYKHLT
jgi:uncharacterized oligopeptide transporter (OPT) family protein